MNYEAFKKRFDQIGISAFYEKSFDASCFDGQEGSEFQKLFFDECTKNEHKKVVEEFKEDILWYISRYKHKGRPWNQRKREVIKALFLNVCDKDNDKPLDDKPLNNESLNEDIRADRMYDATGKSISRTSVERRREELNKLIDAYCQRRQIQTPFQVFNRVCIPTT